MEQGDGRAELTLTIVGRFPTNPLFCDISAPLRTITAAKIEADDEVFFQADDITTIQNLSSQLVQISINGDVTNANFGTLQTSDLRFPTNGSVGVDINNPFILPAGVNRVISTGVDTFYSNPSGKSISISGNASGDYGFTSPGSVQVFNLFASNGVINIQNTGGTTTIGSKDSSAQIVGNDSVSIVNSGSKAKLVINAGSKIRTDAKTAGLGDVLISVGPTSAVTPPDPENVNLTETGGTITFTGSGLVAKGDASDITAQGADVTINNGLKAKAITLNSNSEIKADPPVPAGMPAIVRSAAQSHNHQTTPISTVNGAKESMTDEVITPLVNLNTPVNQLLVLDTQMVPTTEQIQSKRRSIAATTNLP